MIIKESIISADLSDNRAINLIIQNGLAIVKPSKAIVSMQYFFLIVASLLPFKTMANQDKVIVYNWESYIPKGVLEDFTKETGIKVEYLTYNSSDVMMTKLQILNGRGYDVLVSSTNLVEQMYNEGLIQPLDKTLLPNFQTLDSNLLNKPYDPKNKYSVPYLWGSTGIAFNSKKVDARQVRGWKDLWNERWVGKLLLVDNMREVFHMALKINGHSTNSVDEEEISQAYRLLRNLMKNVKIITLDSPADKFVNGEVSVGSMWNGDAATVQLKNPEIQYIYPKEGASFWMDSFVIPSRSLNVKNAHIFINYMLRPEVAIRSVKELNYATPSIKAKEMLDDEIRNNPVIFPPANLLKKAEFQRDVGDKINLYATYWGKLKSAQSGKSGL